MKYEFILKYKEHFQWLVKFNCFNVPDYDFDYTKKLFDDYISKHPDIDYVLLINKLDDDGEFIGVVQ